jgi:hypothetical protein
MSTSDIASLILDAGMGTTALFIVKQLKEVVKELKEAVVELKLSRDDHEKRIDKLEAK